MRVYCPEPLPRQHLYQAFLFRFTPHVQVTGLFKEHLPPNFFETDVSYEENPREADAVILPNNFTYLDSETREYIKKYADIAEQTGKPLYLFSCGDLTDTLEFDSRVHVFRYSIYKSQARSTDISAPTLTEDIGREGITIREKSALPTVSFCGKAGFASQREWLGALLRRLKFEVAGLFNFLARAHIRGVYWRIWALEACSSSPLVKTLFITRKTFSGAARTIEVPPEQARKDFIGSIKESDFVLAPKGDGNYSNRFLEALAMGRIPVLIDTDVALPLEEIIDYKKIVVRVPMNQVSKTPHYIKEFYDALTPQEWTERQRYARESFETYLRQDMFFKNYFRINIS